MQTVRIKCPKCQVVLNVSNINNEPVRLIVCPKCHTQLRVAFPQQPAAPPARDGADESETVIGGTRHDKQTFALLYDGDTYPLSNGVNTVGRKAVSSKASLQIDTDDHKMSRHHAQIQLSRLDNGIVRLKINNWQNKNGTWVNGMPLRDGEVIFIKPGDNIRMGCTEMTLVALG